MTKRNILAFAAVVLSFSILVAVLVITGHPDEISEVEQNGAMGDRLSSDNNNDTAQSGFQPHDSASGTGTDIDVFGAIIRDYYYYSYSQLDSLGSWEAENADFVPLYIINRIPPIPSFEPYPIDTTHPDVYISSTGIMVSGQMVDIYEPLSTVDFGYGADYSELNGITTFRGNNFRDSASYGTADILDAKFGSSWYRSTGNYIATDGSYWSGHGWTGQPLIVKWESQTRSIMDMYEWAQVQDELIEVIYPAMDGYVYFTELETGKPTRSNLYLGYTFKGTGAIDPRGYPLLYLGAGYDGAKGAPRILIVSLIDGSVLHTFGYGDSFAPRAWYPADASPLVDIESDNLIFPSENGIIYILKLNSDFDIVEGTVTIAPEEPTKWRFRGIRSHSGGRFWLGMESSPAIWRGYLFIADNGGHLICLDLNTLEIVWVQDVLDDTNCSPVLELEDGHPYIYISTSFHAGWRASVNASCVVPIWKIDALTGDIVWQVDYMCQTVTEVSGGVQGTIAVGKHGLSGLVFAPVARTPNGHSGILAAIDKSSGEIVWEMQTSSYSWSSPVCVYDKDGKGYLIHCTSDGNMYLLDGLSGERLDSMYLGGLLEASPAVYENTVIIGTRVMRIWGIEIR